MRTIPCNRGHIWNRGRPRFEMLANDHKSLVLPIGVGSSVTWICTGPRSMRFVRMGPRLNISVLTQKSSIMYNHTYAKNESSVPCVNVYVCVCVCVCVVCVNT